MLTSNFVILAVLHCTVNDFNINVKCWKIIKKLSKIIEETCLTMLTHLHGKNKCYLAMNKTKRKTKMQASTQISLKPHANV